MTSILDEIIKVGGYNIYRDIVILENTKNHNYEAKKVKERQRHSLKKLKQDGNKR